MIGTQFPLNGLFVCMYVVHIVYAIRSKLHPILEYLSHLFERSFCDCMHFDLFETLFIDTLLK